MKKLYTILTLVALCGLYACQHSDDEHIDEKPTSPPTDPLANVVYNIDSIYIIKGAYPEGDTLYNIDGNYIRNGKNKTGGILYLVQKDLIYSGSQAKGLPKYCTIGNYICTYGTFRSMLRKDKNYLRKSSITMWQPLSYYHGEVAFNIDGNYLRQGREPNGKIMFTKSGNKYHQGEGTSGSVVFNKDDNYLRAGSSKSGSILFTIREDMIYKGKDSETVSFNISNNYIRKGKAKLAIGEDEQ